MVVLVMNSGWYLFLVGLKITCHLTKVRESLPICRDCFDSSMNLVFSEKATHFKAKGQEDKQNKEKKRKNWN
jgi:hypothetical protein